MSGSSFPSIVRLAEARADATALAILEAIGAVVDPKAAGLVRQGAARLAGSGVPAPAWSSEIGMAVLEGAWILTDVFGDHEGYYAAFRYPGRPAHLLNALVDKALGEIVKDASVGYLKGELEAVLTEVVSAEEGMSVDAVDPAVMARRLVDAIEGGDLYLDNDWSGDFKATRALLLARMRTLPMAPAIEPVEIPDAERDEIIDAFLATPGLPAEGDAEIIARHGLDYTCDYLGEGPYRWSPIVIEQFMLDFVPRKVSLSLAEVKALPDVLRAWVRFALERRGLEERWIVEAVDAVDTFERQFRAEATDPDAFGPAKSIAAQMQADGVDFGDPAAIERWIARYTDSL